MIGDANATFSYTQAPYASNLDPHWIGALAVDPFAGTHAMFGTGHGLFETQLSGGWWAFSINGIEEAAVSGLASPSSGVPLVTTIRDYDGFYHSNLDTTPTRLTPSWGDSFSLDFAESAPWIMVRTHTGSTSSDPRGARSTNGGACWTDFTNSPAEAGTLGDGRIAISANGNNIVWAPDKTTPYRNVTVGTSTTTWTKCNW